MPLKWSCVNSPFLPSLTFNFFGFPILSHAFQSVCAQLECCNTHTKPQTSHLSFFRLILCFPDSMRSYTLFPRPKFGLFRPLNCLWPFVFGRQTWASRPICRLRSQWHKTKEIRLVASAWPLSRNPDHCSKRRSLFQTHGGHITWRSGRDGASRYTSHSVHRAYRSIAASGICWAMATRISGPSTAV